MTTGPVSGDGIAPDRSEYRVATAAEGGSWNVAIVDAAGAEVFRRECRDELEARTFASTVEQHLYWLSPDKFRQYYRLPEGGA